MRITSSGRRVAFFAAAMALALSASAGVFQPYPGGLTVQDEQWPSHTFNTVYDNPNVIKFNIDKAWQAQTDPICTMVRNYAMTPGLLPNGIKVLKVDCTFGPNGSLLIDSSRLGQDVVGLRYVVPGNSISIITSKPPADAGTVALGIVTGGASTALEYGPDNPEFSIDFDINADVNAAVQNMALTISSAVADLQNVHFNSRNFLASLALGLQPSMRTQVETAVKKQQVDLKNQVSNSLALINVAFAPAKDSGYTRIEASYGSDHLLLRLVGKTYQVATTGPGRISGAVYFPANAQPNPAAICAGMTVEAVTPNSFNDVSQFNVTSTVKVGQAGPVIGQPFGQRYDCSYTVTSVPVGVPITINVHAPMMNGDTAAPSPVGWNGTVTLPGFGTAAHTTVATTLSNAPRKPQSPARTVSTVPQTASLIHPVSTTNRTPMSAPPALTMFGIPQPSVAGNTASNLNFSLSWQAPPR